MEQLNKKKINIAENDTSTRIIISLIMHALFLKELFDNRAKYDKLIDKNQS